MRIFASARSLLLISFMLAASANGGIQPNFECGIYRISGEVGMNNNKNYVLTVRKGSSSPYELILVGGNTREKRSRVGARVTAEIYVPQPIKSNNRPFVFLREFQKFGPDDVEAVLMRKADCGDKSESTR